MTAEDAIKDMQNKRIPTKEEVRRSRTIAVVLGGFLVIALVAIVYAFVQQTEAKRQEQLALRLREENEKINALLIVSQHEALQQREIAEEQRRIAVETLNACKSSQKKK